MDAVDRDFVAEHTEGFEDFARFISSGEFRLSRVVRATGIQESEFIRLVDTIATGKRVSFWWTMGVNQSHEAVRVAQAIIDLALMPGSIGRPASLQPLFPPAFLQALRRVGHTRRREEGRRLK